MLFKRFCIYNIITSKSNTVSYLVDTPDRYPTATYKAYYWIILASFPAHVGGGSDPRTRLYAAMNCQYKGW